MSTLSLQNLGYSEKESKVYLALLELGEASVADIAQKTEINRTTVYPVIFKLVKDGIVKKMIKNKKRLFFVDDVKDIQFSLKEKERILDGLLPELKALHNIFPAKPKITYYEGEGGLKSFYLHILNSLSPGDSISEFMGAQDFGKLMPAEFSTFYPEERVRRKIAIKTIATKNSSSIHWVSTSVKFLRQVKLIDSDKDLPFSSNMQIYKSGVGLISYKDHFMGVIIESRDISNMFRNFFNLIWDGIK